MSFFFLPKTTELSLIMLKLNKITEYFAKANPARRHQINVETAFLDLNGKLDEIEEAKKVKVQKILLSSEAAKEKSVEAAKHKRKERDDFENVQVDDENIDEIIEGLADKVIPCRRVSNYMVESNFKTWNKRLGNYIIYLSYYCLNFIL